MTDDNFFIGLMSGTSIDGVDVALIRFSHKNKKSCELVEHYLHPIDESTQASLSQLCSLQSQSDIEHQLDNNNFHNRIELMGKLDHQMGKVFADAVLALLKKCAIDASAIVAIGSHGQTIRHQPLADTPFTLQIGDPNIIAYQTGITTVADFRRMDMAAGGQGAPLAPAFHHAVMGSKKENRVILNLGGIANITLLEKDQTKSVIGFDTGPANTLLDAHYKRYHPNSNHNFDCDAKFAKQGKVCQALLSSMLADPYFKLAPPKSTGREYFCLNWLDKHISGIKKKIVPEDTQATLIALTTQTIANAIKQLNLNHCSIFACGGGMHNSFLLEQLAMQLNQPILKTNDIGIDGDYLEAMLFAWLAKQRLEHKKINLTAITGSKSPQLLGAVYNS
jgi:anhydro-N-acetylmuramic acid kinase